MRAALKKFIFRILGRDPEAVIVSKGAPNSLSGTVAGGSQINLAWTDNSTDEVGFILERARSLPEGGLSSWTTVVTTSQNVTSHNAIGLMPSTIYNYRRLSFNNDGDSIDVQVSNVATPAPTPTPSQHHSSATPRAKSPDHRALADVQMCRRELPNEQNQTPKSRYPNRKPPDEREPAPNPTEIVEHNKRSG